MAENIRIGGVVSTRERLFERRERLKRLERLNADSAAKFTT
jgi:hypothetical protein